MSKIVDLLTYKKRNADEKTYAGSFSPKIIAENFDTTTKEHISNTYILSPLGKRSKNKNAETAMPHTPNASTRKPVFIQLFPWLISILAILLLLVNIVYRGKINVKIEFLSDEISESVAQKTKDIPSIKLPSPATDSGAFFPLASLLISDSRINSQIIKKMGFYGAALGGSKILKNGLCLINDNTAPWASVGFDLLKPTDLTANSLIFTVKGVSGQESLQVILRDADNNSYIPQAKKLLFDKNMASEWQSISIPLNSLVGYYNPRRINHIGFEFGTQTTSNDPGTCIYIRDIQLVRN